MIDANAQFNVKGDSVTDDAPALNAALAHAAATGGGKVTFRGRCKTLSPVVINSSGVWLEGESPITSVLYNPTGSDVLRMGVSGQVLAGMGIRSIGVESNLSGGWGFKADTATDSYVENVRVLNCHNGMGLFNSALLRITGAYINGLKPVVGRGVHIDGGNDQYLTNVTIDNGGVQPYCGFNIAATGGTWLTTCGAVHSGIPFLFQPYGGRTIEHIWTTGCGADTSDQHGWLVDVEPGSILRRWESVNDWAGSCGLNGVAVNGLGQIDGITWQSFRSVYNGYSGFALLAGKNYGIFGSTIAANSRAAHGIHDGVLVHPGVSNFDISHNRIGPVDGFPEDYQRAPVYISPGASDRYFVTHNLVPGNAMPVFDGGTGTNKVVEKNLR